MSWPAIRTEPVATDHKALWLLAKAILWTSLIVPLIAALLVALAFVVMAVGALIGQSLWGMEGLGQEARAELLRPLGVPALFLSAFLFWTLVLAFIGITLMPFVWLIAAPLAALAARAGWAGWAVALIAGAGVGVVTATAFLWWSGGSSAPSSGHGLFSAFGATYGVALWLAIRWSQPGLLRSRQAG